MTPPAQARTPTPVAADGLQGFAARLRATNPFAVNRVDRLRADEVDVDSIRRSPHERIVALAREACEQDRGIGAVLWGEAGAGKSHLLSRLNRWAGQSHNACFVYLHNMLPRPEQLPRYVLKSVVSFLTRGMAGPLHHTPLFRVVNAAVFEALRHDGVSSPTWRVIEASYNRLVNRLAAQDPTRAVLLDRDVYRVLFLFFRSAHASRPKADDGLAPLAVRWLSGESLDPEEAMRLGLRGSGGPEDGVELADDQQVKQALVALAQLARSRSQPFLLCFDQVDNLGRDRVESLTQFLHDLLDSAGNLIVILCGVQQVLLNYRKEGVIHDAAWHRLAQYTIDLLPIGKDEGRHILEARLEKFLEPFILVPEVKVQIGEDTLFPLGLAWYDERVSKLVDVQPRRVIDWARERWEQQQTRLSNERAGEWMKSWTRKDPIKERVSREEAIDSLVTQKITESVARRRQEPQTLPPSPENLSELVYTLLEHCRHRPNQYGVAALSRPVPKKPQPRPYQFEVQKIGQGGKGFGISLLFVGTSSAQETAVLLRRFFQATASARPDRLLLITEQRQPLKLGPGGQEYLKKLSTRGTPAFARIELTFEQYAELDALQAVVGLARSGDLEVEAGPGESPVVREDEVIASHHRRGRYVTHPLLRELLGEAITPAPGPSVQPPAPPAPTPTAPPTPKPSPSVPPPLDEKDLREVIIGRLSFKMGASSHEMAVYYQEYRAKKGQPALPTEACRAAVEAVANKLHAEGKLQATPAASGLYLLWK